MSTQIFLGAAAVLTATLLAQTAAPPAERRLPLRNGFYLEADVPCGEANTAAMLQIMDDRFETARELCTFRTVSRNGNAFTATDECQDTSTGHKRSGKLTMVIPDDHTIIFGTASQRVRYRYCPIPSLPASFKSAQEMVPDTPPFKAPR